jgi:hypothetical protein
MPLINPASILETIKEFMEKYPDLNGGPMFFKTKDISFLEKEKDINITVTNELCKEFSLFVEKNNVCVDLDIKFNDLHFTNIRNKHYSNLAKELKRNLEVKDIVE